MTDAGMNSFKGFTENWQKALNDTNASAFNNLLKTGKKL